MTSVGTPARGVFLDDLRLVRASAAEVHGALTNALSGQGFDLVADQLTYVEAKRGSSLMGAVDKARLGIHATAWVTPSADGCQIRVRLQYRGMPLSSAPGPQAVLREAFAETARAVDVALAALDPSAAFEPAVLTTAGPNGARQEQLDLGIAAQAAAVEDSGVPAAWSARAGVLFTFGDRVAWLDPDAAQAHLAISRLVLATADALPPELRAQLEQFTVRIEQLAAANPAALTVVPITADERPVLAFVHQQVRVRSALPVRVLHRCRDCQLEKVTNPDYAKTVQHSRNVRAIGGALGATVSRGGLAPIVMIGTLFQAKRVDPDYVCPRCQGMSAEETFVTFCKGCGDLRKDAILRTCPKCSFDFRSLLRKEAFWVAAPPQPAAVAASPLPPAVPMRGPLGGKVCRVCGQEFSTLWRVLVAGSGQPEEWFVCATSPQCTPESLTDPVLV